MHASYHIFARNGEIVAKRQSKYLNIISCISAMALSKRHQAWRVAYGIGGNEEKASKNKHQQQ